MLTRRDFVRYDAASGPAGAVVQTLLLSRHLLVIGASLTDDNFLHLAHEMEHFLEEGGAKRRNLGTVLTFSADRGRPMLFQGVFDFVDVGAQTGRTGPGRSVPTDVTSPTGTAGQGGSGGPPPTRARRTQSRLPIESCLCAKLCT